MCFSMLLTRVLCHDVLEICLNKTKEVCEKLTMKKDSED